MLLARSLAQQSPQLTVSEILNRLRENITTYLSSVPSFFCDEHVDSNLFEPNNVKITTGTDSVFHIRRTGEGNRTQLIESREIKAVNRMAATGENIAGPVVFRGAFTNGIRITSSDFVGCYDFQRDPDQDFGNVRAIVLSYKAVTEGMLNHSCPDIHDGKVFVDPRSFHLLRVEARIPNHEITRRTYGLWTWSIDYAPVLLDGRTFWMPGTIESQAIPDDHLVAWSFVAKYSNYHKLEVTSHIVPNTTAPVSIPPQ